MSKRVSQISPMLGQKRGQIYLVATIIIIAIIGGLISFANRPSVSENFDFSHVKEELQIESEKVMDYGINSNGNLIDLFENFTVDYSDYSDMDTLYFIYGNNANAQFSGFNKLDEIKTISIITDSEQVEQNIGDTTVHNPLNNAGNFVNITMENSVFSFRLVEAQSFYFILTKELGDDVYVVTNESP